MIDMNSIFLAHFHGGVTHFPIAFIFAAALFDNSLQARQSLRMGEDIHRGVPWNWRAKARMTFRRLLLRPAGVEPATFSSGGR